MCAESGGSIDVDASRVLVQLLGIGDCWPDAVKCAKGDHIVRVHVRSHPRGMLMCSIYLFI